MGAKILVEIEVGYSDLSTDKHVAMLRHVLKKHIGVDIKAAKLVTCGRPIFYGEQIVPEQCSYCQGTGNQSAEGRGIDCEYCEGSGKKE